MKLKIKPPLALFSAVLSGLALSACDLASTGSQIAVPEAATGDFAYAVDSETFAAARPLADSLRVELRQGETLRTFSATLASPVRIDRLGCGRWDLTIGLYAKDGSLKYAATDTVSVRADRIAQPAKAPHPAIGSVDSRIRIDSSHALATPLESPIGDWYLRELAGRTVQASLQRLIIRKGGTLAGSIQCNGLSGTWASEGRRLVLRHTQTLIGCSDTAFTRLGEALLSVRSWTQDLSNGNLVLMDSTGKVLARYGIAPPPQCDSTRAPSSPSLRTWYLQTLGQDTVRHFRATLSPTSDGMVHADNGCIPIQGRWDSANQEVRWPDTTYSSCLDNEAPSLAVVLTAARRWKLDPSSGYLKLNLIDSAGKSLATYGTYPLASTEPLPDLEYQEASLDSLDTARLSHHVEVGLEAALPTDSGLLLSVWMGSPMRIQLIALPADFTACRVADSSASLASAASCSAPPRTYLVLGSHMTSSVGEDHPTKVLVRGFHPEHCKGGSTGAVILGSSKSAVTVACQDS